MRVYGGEFKATTKSNLVKSTIPLFHRNERLNEGQS